jgi:hypothetical protein
MTEHMNEHNQHWEHHHDRHDPVVAPVPEINPGWVLLPILIMILVSHHWSVLKESGRPR